MKAYVFNAALWCEDCATRYMREHEKPAHVDADQESNYDSDEWPKGPYCDGGGEADTPQHCEACGLFLENPLTPDGAEYVREQLAEFETEVDSSWSEIAEAADAAGKSVAADWARHYLAWGI